MGGKLYREGNQTQNKKKRKEMGGRGKRWRRRRRKRGRGRGSRREAVGEGGGEKGDAQQTQLNARGEKTQKYIGVLGGMTRCCIYEIKWGGMAKLGN